MKKIIALLTAVAVILTVLPPIRAVGAADDFVIDQYGELWRYNGAGGDVVIPDGVTSIRGGYYYYSTGAFQDCTSLTSITIPISLKIGL